jgi:hypothetical protein
MNYIYTRPTLTLTAQKQNEAILAHFASEWHNYPKPQRYTENRLKMERFKQMLAQADSGDVVYCYDPAIFGIGVGQCCESLRALLQKGAQVRSVMYGTIEETDVCAIEIAGDIVRECCAIERMREIEHNKGVREVSGGYFDEDTGRWRQGTKKTYEPPKWAFIGQRSVDEARFARESSNARRWIDAKIMDAWTTERIWKEYKVLCSILEEDVWERVSKGYVNTRRLELIK